MWQFSYFDYSWYLHLLMSPLAAIRREKPFWDSCEFSSVCRALVFMIKNLIYAPNFSYHFYNGISAVLHWTLLER